MLILYHKKAELSKALQRSSFQNHLGDKTAISIVTK